MENALAAYTELGIESSVSIPASVTIFCFFFEVAVLVFVTVFGLHRISVKAPLELLQPGGKHRRIRVSGLHIRMRIRRATSKHDSAKNKENSRYSRISGDIEKASSSQGIKSTAANHKSQKPTYHTQTGKTSIRKHEVNRVHASVYSCSIPFIRSAIFVIRYNLMHIRRSAAKSLLSLGLTLLLAGTICELTIIRSIYKDAYNNLEVKAYVLGGFGIQSAVNVDESEYIRKPVLLSGSTPYRLPPYYENTFRTLECKYLPITVIMTNNIEHYCGNAVEIEYLEGYSNQSMSIISMEKNNICVIDEIFMEINGIELGDTVGFCQKDFPMSLEMSLQADDSSPDRKLKHAEEITKLLNDSTADYTVVGKAVSGANYASVFVPVGTGLEPVRYGTFKEDWANQQIFEYIEYTLLSPDYANDFYSFARHELTGSATIMPDSLIVDTSEADNMRRTVNLLDGLYPIAVAAAAILGGLFPGLIVLQSDREASIMRVLGTTKKRARAILVLEQASLGIIGLLLAAILLLAINGAALASYAQPLASCAALLIAASALGASVCAVIITRRRPLELLQVKE